MTCAEVTEKLIDFLYDEMSSEARAAFAQHLDSCPGCKAEVASFQKALGNSRVALAGTLSQEPPLRVRLAVLEAAAQAVTERGATAGALRRAPATTSKTDEQDGFFARLLRSPWLLPAFGAASVATVVFLVRVLKNPEVLPGQQPRIIDEVHETPVPVQAEEPKPALGPRPEKAAANVREGVAGSPPAQSSAGRHKAVTAKRRTREEPSGTVTDEAPLNARGTAAQEARRFAEPPPPRPAPAIAPAAEAVAAPAPMAAPSRAAASAAQPAPAVAKSAVADEKADRDNGSPADESMRKADRLFASRNWKAAADVYRELLRRFPSHQDVRLWRDRLNTATAAYQESLEGKP